MSDSYVLGSDRRHETLKIGALGFGSVGKGSSGWLGIVMLILTEGSLFGYLLFSYFYMQLQLGRDWLPPELPSFRLSGPNTVLLVLSSVAVWAGERGVKHDRRWLGVAGLSAGFVLGSVFVGIQVKEWMDKPFVLDTSSYSSLFFTITGFHMAHVIVGLFVLATLILWTALGLFGSGRHAPIGIGSLYWHFVDAVWLAVFTSLYITPYFM